MYYVRWTTPNWKVCQRMVVQRRERERRRKRPGSRFSEKNERPCCVGGDVSFRATRITEYSCTTVVLIRPKGAPRPYTAHLQDATMITLEPGVRVKAYYASQVFGVRMRHENLSLSPSVVTVRSTDHYVNVMWPVMANADDLIGVASAVEKFPMRMNQIPLVRNTGTTGHKLQGKSVESVMVFEWSYGTNWPYVVLSRVRTKTGLYLRLPLNTDLSRYTLPVEYVKWYQKFKHRQAGHPSIEDYDEVVCMPRNVRR